MDSARAKVSVEAKKGKLCYSGFGAEQHKMISWRAAKHGQWKVLELLAKFFVDGAWFNLEVLELSVKSKCIDTFSVCFSRSNYGGRDLVKLCVMAVRLEFFGAVESIHFGNCKHKKLSACSIADIIISEKKFGLLVPFLELAKRIYAETDMPMDVYFYNALGRRYELGWNAMIGRILHQLEDRILIEQVKALKNF